VARSVITTNIAVIAVQLITRSRFGTAKRGNFFEMTEHFR